MSRYSQQFDFNKIKVLANKNGLIVRLKADNTILEIKSPLNIWICEVKQKMNYRDKVIELIHETRSRGKGRHPQNTFKDYKFMFESIKRHDRFKIKRKGTNIVDEVINRHKNNRISKSKIN
jgi:hypothetical protein